MPSSGAVIDLAGLDLSAVLAPALGLGASGALLAVRATAVQRQVPVIAPPLAPLPVLAGMLLSAAVAVSLFGDTTAGSVLRWALGVAALAGCLAAGWTAGQLWRHAELLRSARPCAVDDALALPGPDRGRKWLLVHGRLGAAGEVTSPGGVGMRTIIRSRPMLGTTKERLLIVSANKSATSFGLDNISAPRRLRFG